MTDDNEWKDDTSLFPPRRRLRTKIFLFVVYVLIAFPVSPLLLAAAVFVAAWFNQ